MPDYHFARRAVERYPGYLPQPLSLDGVRHWIKQFNWRDRRYVLRFLEHVVYLTEEAVKNILLEQNEALTQQLLDSGLRREQFIYVQTHEAGSSSAVMVNMLRDSARLENRCTFVDSRAIYDVRDKTREIGEGALIYVDDFIGSGQQLVDQRNFTIPFVQGTFSEFVLVPSICEEGRNALEALGIEVFSGHLHEKAQRPLHPESTIIDEATKARLRDICESIDQQMALGFRHMAVMVVLYRNAPDNVPRLLRGSPGQVPYVGVFPRTTDMPYPP